MAERSVSPTAIGVTPRPAGTTPSSAYDVVHSGTAAAEPSAPGVMPQKAVSQTTSGNTFIGNQLADAADSPDSEPAGYTPPPSIFAKAWDWLLTHPTDTAGLNQFIWGTLASFTLGLLWKLGRRK